MFSLNFNHKLSWSLAHFRKKCCKRAFILIGPQKLRLDDFVVSDVIPWVQARPILSEKLGKTERLKNLLFPIELRSCCMFPLWSPHSSNPRLSNWIFAFRVCVAADTWGKKWLLPIPSVVTTRSLHLYTLDRLRVARVRPNRSKESISFSLST